MLAVTFPLPFCREAGSYDADKVIFTLRVNHNRNSAIDFANCDESILGIRVSGVKDLQVILATLEELRSLRERQTMLFLVAAVLGVVLLESHTAQYKSMAECANGLQAQCSRSAVQIGTIRSG